MTGSIAGIGGVDGSFEGSDIFVNSRHLQSKVFPTNDAN